jgi:hypothetical protein
MGEDEKAIEAAWARQYADVDGAPPQADFEYATAAELDAALDELIASGDMSDPAITRSLAQLMIACAAASRPIPVLMAANDAGLWALILD